MSTTVPFKTCLFSRRVQPVGADFIRFFASTQHGISNAESEEKISESQVEFAVDVAYLRSLDPKEWKDQDHYAVLGLKHLRCCTGFSTWVVLSLILFFIFFV